MYAMSIKLIGALDHERELLIKGLFIGFCIIRILWPKASVEASDETNEKMSPLKEKVRLRIKRIK